MHQRLPLFLCAGVILAAGLNALHVRALLSRPHGRFTYERASDRAHQLCRLLLRPGVDLEVSPIPAHIYVGGRVVRIWTVQCASANGDSATFDWDADSGDLLRATAVPCRVTQTCAAGRMTRLQAIEIAVELLRVLAVLKQASRWRLVDMASAGRSTWRTCWRAADRQAMVCVYPQSHVLVQVELTRRTSAPSRPDRERDALR